MTADVVFLLDVDNTLLDADRIVDYLGALQRYRIDVEQGNVDEQRLLMMASFLIDYPFSERLYAEALVYVHKEEMLEAVQRHYPARHYVMVDDKLRILAAMKAIWQERLTTVFARQGHYALDPQIVAAQPDADFTIERIGDLVELDLSPLIKLPVNKARATKEIR